MNYFARYVANRALLVRIGEVAHYELEQVVHPFRRFLVHADVAANLRVRMDQIPVLGDRLRETDGALSSPA